MKREKLSQTNVVPMSTLGFVASMESELVALFVFSFQICPVCAAHPSGIPNHLTDDFPGHLMLDHSRTLRDSDGISLSSYLYSQICIQTLNMWQVAAQSVT